MNQLARVIYRLTLGEQAGQAGLSDVEKSAMADLPPVLRQNPSDLAAWLDQEQVPPEEWLILPSTISLQPRA
jgi:hypothetical protein